MTALTTIGIHLHFQHEHPYQTLFLTMSGSRGYGIDSPTSDYDVHGVHALPLDQVLGFSAEKDQTWLQKMSIPDAQGDTLEVELATHDIKKFLHLLKKGNGNVLEDLYSPQVIKSGPFHEELMDIGQGCITKMCANHYKGMAFNQQQKLASHEIKKYLHTIRCLLMGTHLMNTGTILMDMWTLMDLYGVSDTQDLIAWKRAGQDRVPDVYKPWYERLFPHLFEELEKAMERSSLPEQTSEQTIHALEDLLIRTRKGLETTGAKI